MVAVVRSSPMGTQLCAMLSWATSMSECSRELKLPVQLKGVEHEQLFCPYCVRYDFAHIDRITFAFSHGLASVVTMAQGEPAGFG